MSRARGDDGERLEALYSYGQSGEGLEKRKSNGEVAVKLQEEEEVSGKEIPILIVLNEIEFRA